MTYHTNDPLEQDVIGLFDDDRIHVRTMRQFFKEAVCDYLDEDTEHPEHEEAALRLFDRWYRNLRRTIWTNAAKYTLIEDGCSLKEAEKESITMYRTAYRNIDRKRRKETSNED